MARTKLQ